jgi:hypothetical protein
VAQLRKQQWSRQSQTTPCALQVMKLLPSTLILFTGAWGRRHREAVVCWFAIVEGLLGTAIFARYTLKPHAFLEKRMYQGIDVLLYGPLFPTARQVQRIRDGTICESELWP